MAADFSGQRIAIIGPSSSGKSTLADTLGRVRKLPVLHLDQLAHKPGTHWERIPDAELIERHRAFISENDRWVVEGNYSICMAERFEKADTVIWCDPSLIGCMYRYLLRCLKSSQRVGGLENAQSEFNIELVHYTFTKYPPKRKAYAQLIKEYPHLQVLYLKSFKEIREFCGSVVRSGPQG